MSTFLQRHSAALARAMRHAGETFAFGAAEFRGSRGVLKPDDPRLPGAGDRALLLTVVADELPAGAGTTGAELTSGTARYRVTRPATAQPGGSVQLVIVPLV